MERSAVVGHHLGVVYHTPAVDSCYEQQLLEVAHNCPVGHQQGNLEAGLEEDIGLADIPVLGVDTG